MNQKSKVLDTLWFTNRRGTIGICLTVNEVGERRVFISPVFGDSDKDDRRFVTEWGSEIPVEEMINFLSRALPKKMQNGGKQG